MSALINHITRRGSGGRNILHWWHLPALKMPLYGYTVNTFLH